MEENQRTKENLFMKMERRVKSWFKTLSNYQTKISVSANIVSWEIEGNIENSEDFIFLGHKITTKVTSAVKLKDAVGIGP